MKEVDITFDLFVLGVESELEEVEKGLDMETGKMIVNPGDELFKVHFAPLTLKKEEYWNLLSKTKQHQLKVKSV